MKVRHLLQPQWVIWTVVAVALVVIAVAGSTQIIAKVYAFVGSLLLAWPFFRANNLRKRQSDLRGVKAKSEADQTLIDAAADRLEQAEVEWSRSDTISMQGGIVLLIVSFFVDLCLSLQLIA